MLCALSETLPAAAMAERAGRAARARARAQLARRVAPRTPLRLRLVIN